MSIRREVTLWCDAEGCCQWWIGHAEHTAERARKVAAGEGWRTIDGYDLCPEHARADRGRQIRTANKEP